tara:strand:- start:6749 stop:7648 length:900 start_codon:yes stop_codon:yes gene_type:complete
MKYLNYEFKNGVLYNEKNEIISDEECWNGIPQCRITSKELFHEKVKNEMLTLFPKYSDRLIGNSEIVFQYLSNFAKYKNKKLLIVGGGPTTNQCQWEKLDYDYIWSCNHYYRHPKLKDMGVDLTFIGQEVKLYDKEFQENVYKHNTKLVFEIAGKFYNKFGHDNLNLLPGYDIKNHLCCFTRYYGWIGANWRQMILALFLGFKEIYFVGMDGYSFKKNPRDIPHSFEPGKVPAGGPMKPGAEEAFKQHLIVFWNYILNELNPDVKLHNLGEFSDDNMSRYISKEYFPLTDDIKKTIGVL